MIQFNIVVEGCVLKIFKQRHGVYLVFNHGHEVGTVYSCGNIKRNVSWEPHDLMSRSYCLKILDAINIVECDQVHESDSKYMMDSRVAC